MPVCASSPATRINARCFTGWSTILSDSMDVASSSVSFLDRGFIDGPSIGRRKREYHIDVLIPARTNIDVYHDAVGLAEAGVLQFQSGSPPTPMAKPVPVHRPEAIRKREEKRQRTLAQRM